MRLRTRGLFVAGVISFLSLGNAAIFGQADGASKPPAVRWGGPGYDHLRVRLGSTRFVAQRGGVDESTKKDLIEIWVDAEKTHLDLAQVILSSNDGKISATSIRCGKSQKHITAAWICLFLAEDLVPLPDEGRLKAKDSSGNLLLDEPVDLKMIKSLLSPNGPSTKIGVEEEIWASEEAYFANLYKADYDGVLALTHSQFLGWPSAAPQPIDKGGSARFMKQLISQPTSCIFRIERGGIRVLGEVALTQYTIHVSCNAAAEAKTQNSRITHTWVKEGASWKLLGGMSYDL